MNLFETLENRQLMSAAITDMTALAQQHGPHSGLTYLHLNFDGGTINDTQGGAARTISAFQPEIGQDRQQAIQDILYKESEIFAPFNVRVDVMSGAGRFSKINGDTTIFIGDNTANVDGQGLNETYSDTPANSMDYPTPHKGSAHVLNSDPYDIAFVDPVSTKGAVYTTTESDGAIATSIAHEAGHTFGLAHVLSLTNGTLTNEMMSYNAPDQYFSNNTFNITDLNNNGSSTTDDPGVVPTLSTGQLKTQNSYTCLLALLGPTTFASNVYYEHRVADTTLVDSTFSSTMSPIASLQTTTITSSLLDPGEYDVYSFTHTSTVAQTYTINVSTRGAIFPQVFVYDSTGATLITSFSGKTGQFTANGNYKIVIGSVDDTSSGSYGISFQPAHVAELPLFSTTPILQQQLTA